MISFTKTLPQGRPDLYLDKNPLSIHVRESACGRWQLALNPTVMGSVRLNVSHRDYRGSYLTVYCLGEDRIAWAIVPRLVERYMGTLAEDLPPVEFWRLMPPHSILTDDTGYSREARPIATDPELVRKLAAMAGVSAADVENVVTIVCRREAAEVFS